jgi:hypothetical protein
MCRDRLIIGLAMAFLFVIACAAWAEGWEASARIWFMGSIFEGLLLISMNAKVPKKPSAQ